MTVLKGNLATAQSKNLIRLFKQMKEYVLENQQIVSQRDYVRLTLQTADNTNSIHTLRHELAMIDDKIEGVVSNLGEMVRKSELSPIMLNLGKSEIPSGWLILNGHPVESDLAYKRIYSIANKSIFIIDNYMSLKTLVLVKDAKRNIDITIYSDNVNNGLHRIEYEDFCKEYPFLNIQMKQSGGVFHDRYIVIDYNTSTEKIFHCGSSSKDGGRKVSTITLIEDGMAYNQLFMELQKNQELVLK